MFGVRECSNGQGVLQCLGLGSGSAPMSGVRVRELLQCLGLGSGSAPIVWG